MRVTNPRQFNSISSGELVRRANLNMLKKSFLDDLRSPSNPLRYKRYSKTPLRYAGGKSLGVGFVLEKIPPSVKRVVSPFLGGGSVEIAIANELNLPVIGYDIFDILINFWKVQLGQPGALYRRLAEFSPTRTGFRRVGVSRNSPSTGSRRSG